MLLGQRIRLRPIEREDLPRFVKWLADEETRSYVGQYLPYSLAQEEQWFEHNVKAGEEQAWAIDAQPPDMALGPWEHIGSCGFNKINWRNRQGELGILIGAREYWGRGYGNDAFRTLIAWGFTTLNLNRVYLRVFADNLRALRCYQKIGFVEEGRLRQDDFRNGAYRDTLVLGLLRAEWETARAADEAGNLAPLDAADLEAPAMYGQIKLFSGSGCPALAAEIAKHLGVPLSGRDIIKFPNENIFVRLHSSVRGQDVYVIQTTSAPVSDNLMELLIAVQTLKLDSAARITVVIPYLAYARSDKKDQPRVPITARLVADMIEVAGADRYITLDLHAGQIQGFFSIPGDVLTAFNILSDYIAQKRATLKDPVIVTADLGFAKKGRNFAAKIDASMAFIEKRRAGNDAKAQAMTVIGDVRDKDVIIVDDEVDTGSSVSQAVQIVKAHGAREVYLAFAHPVLSYPAVDRLRQAALTEIITTNSIPLPPEKQLPNLKVLSVAALLGDVIKRAHEGRSVGEMFNE